MSALSIHSPRVIATARFLGITELQALRHERARDWIADHSRRPELLLQYRAD